MSAQRTHATAPTSCRPFAELVAHQLGAFSRQQACHYGFSASAIQRRLAREEWVVVHRGVYRLATAAQTWRQALFAASLLAGEQGFVSHASAAALHGLPDFGPGPVEITTPRQLRSEQTVTVHRSEAGTIGDVQRLGPVIVASPTRTIVDLAAIADELRLETALDDALRRRLTSLPRMYRRLDVVGVQGRAGITRLRSLLDERDPSAAVPESVLERKFIRFLRRFRLPMPTSQHVVRLEGRFIGRVDFAYTERRVIIEVDSYQFHSRRLQWEADLLRRNRLEAMGWRVLNVTARQLGTNPGETAELISAMLTTQLALPIEGSSMRRVR